MATPEAVLVVPGAEGVMTSPPVPKLASRLPSLALYRARAKSSAKLDGSWTVPATTMALVPGSRATPATEETLEAPKLVRTSPPVPKPASRWPSALKRARPKSVLKPPLKSATVPASDDLAIGLEGQVDRREEHGQVGAEVGGGLAAGTEGGVQLAVAVVVRHAEIADAVDRDRARHHDLAVGGDGDARRARERVGAEVGQDLAADAEGSVQAAVLVVPRQGEVLDVVTVREALEGPRHHDLAVGLGRHGRGHGRSGGEGREDRAAVAESGVEAAVLVVARHGEGRLGIHPPGRPRHHDLAVALPLDGDAAGGVGGGAEDRGGGRDAADAEARIERARPEARPPGQQRPTLQAFDGDLISKPITA